MKKLLLLPLLLCSILLSQDSSLNVEKDELVLEVNGMVCGMCAFGIQEGLSELSFLNNKKFEEDGIEVDLDTQMIYIPIDLSKTIDQLEAVQIVKDVGYDTVFIYTKFFKYRLNSIIAFNNIIVFQIWRFYLIKYVIF